MTGKRSRFKGLGKGALKKKEKHRHLFPEKIAKKKKKTINRNMKLNKE